MDRPTKKRKPINEQGQKKPTDKSKLARKDSVGSVVSVASDTTDSGEVKTRRPRKRKDVEALLALISADCDREDWMAIGCACTGFDQRSIFDDTEEWGYDVWHTWCKKDMFTKDGSPKTKDGSPIYPGAEFTKSKYVEWTRSGEGRTDVVGWNTIVEILKLNHPEKYAEWIGEDPTGTKEMIMEAEEIEVAQLLRFISNYHSIEITNTDTTDIISDYVSIDGDLNTFIFNKKTGYWEGHKGNTMQVWVIQTSKPLRDKIEFKWLKNEARKLEDIEFKMAQNKEESGQYYHEHQDLKKGVARLRKALNKFSSGAGLPMYGNFIKSDTSTVKTNLLDNNHKGVGKATWLVPFSNGVFDLNACEFRPTQRTDYLQASLNYEYPQHLTKDPVFWGKLKQMIIFYIESVTGDNTEYPGNADFLLKWLAGTLPAKNSFQEMLIILGAGGNGKSQLFGNVMLQVWGGTASEDGALTAGAQFIEPLDPQWWAARTKSGAPDEAMFAVRKARMVYTSEGVGFDITKMKQLTGEDVMDTREMFGKRIKFTPGFCPVVYSNDDPDLPSVMTEEEISLTRRCVCLKFPFQFSESLKPGFREPTKCVPNISRMLEDPNVKIPFLGEEEESVTCRTFVHGIMMYLLELWTNEVGALVFQGKKLPRTPSIAKWSTELLSGSKVFDEFLDSGVICVMKEKTSSDPFQPKCAPAMIHMAFMKWCGNIGKKNKDKLSKEIFVQKLTQANKLKDNGKGKGFPLIDNVFQYMQFDSSKIGVEMIKQGKADDYPSTEFNDFDAFSGFGSGSDSEPEPQTKKTMTTEERRDKLRELKQDFDEHLINEHEYQEMRSDVVAAFKAGLA